MVGVNPGENVTSHFTKLEIMPLKMLFNYGILKLFLEIYGKDEIDNIVPSHNYDTREKTVVHWCQIVQVNVQVWHSASGPMVSSVCHGYSRFGSLVCLEYSRATFRTATTLASWLSGWSLFLSFVCFYYNKQIFSSKYIRRK